MGSNNYSRLFFTYSDEIKAMCERFIDKPFNYSDVLRVAPNYNKSLHQKLCAVGLIIKSRERDIHVRTKVTNRPYAYKSQTYTVGSEIKSWYNRNYVSCNGTGKLVSDQPVEKKMIPFSEIMKYLRVRSYDQREYIKFKEVSHNKIINRLIKAHQQEYDKYFEEECKYVTWLVNEKDIDALMFEYKCVG